MLNSTEPVCRNCGSQLQPSFKPASSLLTEIPFSIIDMHQIIPLEKDIASVQIEYMTRLSIPRALLQSVPSAMRSIGSNADLRELRKAYPEKFIISQFVDPRYPFIRKKLRKYARDGINVIKLLPCLGYFPDEKKYDSFWKEMEDCNLTAMVHTGFISARHKKEEKEHGRFLSSKFGNPLYFDIICRKCPELKIILCHSGGSLWYEEASQMIDQHQHVWGDVSGFGSFALQRILALNISINWEKLFWGNDSHPTFYFTNLNIITSILIREKKEHLLEKLLYSNADLFIKQQLRYDIA